MDDETTKLLREIRDRLARGEARRGIVYCVALLLMLIMTACALFRLGLERERDRRESVRNMLRATGERPTPE